MSSGRRELLIICDASPLILLAKVGRLDLLPALAVEIWIPAAVWPWRRVTGTPVS